MTNLEQRLKGRPWNEQLEVVGEYLQNRAEEFISTDPLGQGIRTLTGTYLDIRNNTYINLGGQLERLTRDTRAGWFWRGGNPPPNLRNQIYRQGLDIRPYFDLLPDRMDYSSPEAYRESLEGYRDDLYEGAERFIPGGGEPVGTYSEIFGPPHFRRGFDVAPFWRNSPPPPPPPPPSLTPPTPPPIYTTDRGEYLDRVDLRQTFHTYRASTGTTRTTIIIPGEPTQDYTEETGNQEYLPDGDYYQRVYFPESENLHWARPNEIAYFTSPCASLDNPETGCIDSPTAVCLIREYETSTRPPRYNYYYSDQFGYAYELEYFWSVLETVRLKANGLCYVLGYATHSAQIVVSASDTTTPLSGGGTMRTTSSGQFTQYATNPVAFTLYFNNDLPDPIPPPPPPPPPECDCMSCNCCPCGTIAAIVAVAKTEIMNELRQEVTGAFAAQQCNDSTLSSTYQGTGIAGLAAQIQAQHSSLKFLLEGLCSSGGGDSGLTERIYKILGGDSWFADGNDTTPSVKFVPEGVIEGARANAYNNNSPQEIEAFSLLGVLSNLLSVNHHRSGHQEFPFSVPSSLTASEPQQISIHNYAAWQEWLVRQLDALHGQYPIKFAYIDANNQRQIINIPNQAEAIAEIMGILLSLNADIDIIQAAVFKTGVEAMGAKVAATTAADYGAANAEFLGYKSKTQRRDLPFAFNPKAKNLKDALRETTQKATQFVMDQDEDLMEYIKRLLVGVEIVRAAFYKPLEQGLPGERIKEDLAGETPTTDNQGQPTTEGDVADERWREFLSTLENPPQEQRQQGAPLPDVNNIEAGRQNP